MPSVYVLVKRPELDLTPAERYGKVQEILTEADTQKLDLTKTLRKLDSVLSKSKPDDWIIPVGSPLIIAAAGQMAAQANGGWLNLLMWDRIHRVYIPRVLDMETREENRGEIEL